MLWKTITVLLMILLLVFGYVTIKNKGLMPTNTEGAAESAQKFSNNFMSSFFDLTGNSAVLPSDFGYNVPTISQEELGELSPLYGMITISKKIWGPAAEILSEEYVVLNASEENTESVNITGWSLQSMTSGVRMYIPDGVEDLIVNDINATYEVELAPGQEAIVASNASPLGVSFKTNICTGYLGQFQNFEPELEKNCPSPQSVLPPTVTNIATYGRECIDFASDLRRCQYVTDESLASRNLNSACVEHLRTAFTYTSCRAHNIETREYTKDTRWRIFLSAQNPLWAKNYEVIRLLDEESRTVDVYAY